MKLYFDPNLFRCDMPKETPIGVKAKFERSWLRTIWDLDMLNRARERYTIQNWPVEELVEIMVVWQLQVGKVIGKRLESK